MNTNKPDPDDVNAIYQSTLRGFYQLPADRLATISMETREQVARQGAIDFIWQKYKIKMTEEELSSLVALSQHRT